GDGSADALSGLGADFAVREVGKGAHRRRPVAFDVADGEADEHVRRAGVAADAVDVELFAGDGGRNVEDFGDGPGLEVVGDGQADVAEAVVEVADVGAVLPDVRVPEADVL